MWDAVNLNKLFSEVSVFSVVSEFENGIKGCQPKLTGIGVASVLQTDNATDKPNALSL
jgi:hypothetical protein